MPRRKDPNAPRLRRPAPSAHQALESITRAAKPTSAKVGRPSTYSPAICEHVMSLGKQGKSRMGIAAALHVDRSTINKWETEHEEFSQALARAKAYEQEWWENRGQKSLARKHFQAQVWRTSMAARFKEEYTEGRSMAQDIVDLGAAIADVIAARRPAASLPGDRAKPIEATVVKDDAPDEPKG